MIMKKATLYFAAISILFFFRTGSLYGWQTDTHEQMNRIAISNDIGDWEPYKFRLDYFLSDWLEFNTISTDWGRNIS